MQKMMTKKIDKVLEKLEEYCEPRKNVSYESYKFFSRAQESSKTIGQYVIVLRKLWNMWIQYIEELRYQIQSRQTANYISC